MRLTRAGVSLSTAGLVLLGLGMSMANLELLLLSAFPLTILAYTAAQRARGTPKGARSLSTRTPRRADPLDMTMRVELPPGSQLVEVHAPLPGSWRLEQGSNLHALVGGGARVFGFRSRAFGRGRHTLAPVTGEVIDPSGLVGPREVALTGEETVEVTVRSFASKPIRGAVQGTLALPELAMTRMGFGTSDFRELRDYRWGDPIQAIDWKSSARRLSRKPRQSAATNVPLVKEYEQEGRRSVLVLLDGGHALRIGTTLETGLDHGTEAATAAARFFLARGARVGAATYGARSTHLAVPEAGSGQAFAIDRALSAGELADEETPVRALERFHRHIAGTQPLVVVATRVTPDSKEQLIELAGRLRAMVGPRASRLPLVVLDVDALPLIPREQPAVETAAQLVAQEDAQARRELAASGARVVTWHLNEKDFRTAIIGGRRG